MWKTKIKIGNLFIYLELKKNRLFTEKNGQFYFGTPLFPIEQEKISLSPSDLHQMKGSFFVFDGSKESKIALASDYFGGIRMYYLVIESNYYFSDDYLSLISILGRKKLTINEDELQYWDSQGYTTGGSTFFNEIKKIEPHTIIEISSAGMEMTSYFKEFKVESQSLELFKESILNDINNTISRIKKLKKVNVLCFSGGMDSVLIASQLSKNEVEFSAIYFLVEPYEKQNYTDYQKAIKVAKFMGINLEPIVIKVHKEVSDELLGSIADEMLFDKHPSIIHFVSSKKIGDKFGPNTLIINGQTSDSIFSYGPSCGFSKSFSEPLARLSLYRSLGLLNRIGCYIYSKKLKIKLNVPKNESQYFLSFIDHVQYKLYFREKANYKYLDKYIKLKTKNVIDKNNKRMVLKINTFIQGSDNQVVNKSASLNGVSVVMPFASAGIVNSCLLYKDDSKEIIRGKYVIPLLIKDINYEVYQEVINTANISTKGVTYSNITIELKDKLFRVFNKKINQLTDFKYEDF